MGPYPLPPHRRETKILREGGLNRHNFLFFGNKQVVDSLAKFISKILDGLFKFFQDVFGDHSVSFLLTDGFVALTPDLSNGDLGIFGFLFALLHDLGTDVLVHWRYIDADSAAFKD